MLIYVKIIEMQESIIALTTRLLIMASGEIVQATSYDHTDLCVAMKALETT